MTTTAGSADADTFSDVFRRDSGAETAAPEASPGQPRTPDGKFAAKEPEQQEQPQQSAPPVQAEQPPTASPESKEDPARNRHVPLPELLSERDKRKAAEAAREEAENRVRWYEDQLRQARQAPQSQPQQQQPQRPDPFVDPEGFAAYQETILQQQLVNERANFSELRARDKFGDDAVDAALQAAPPQVRMHCLRTVDPYGELIKWHKQASFMHEVGTDPSAYKTRLEKQIREQVLAELKAGKATQQSAPRFPGSLADATPTGDQGAHITEESVARDIFGPGRNRRSA